MLVPLHSQGTVKLFFQPAEEGHAGAYHMIQEGSLDDVQAIFGMHVEPGLPTGTIACSPGPVLAAAGTFQAVIKGKGGHAAFPHKTADPILAASFAILSLQQIVSRESDPLDSLVSFAVFFCRICFMASSSIILLILAALFYLFVNGINPLRVHHVEGCDSYFNS